MSQGVFFNIYFMLYLVSPRFCHSFVGYLEEEAVHTYTVLLKQLDEGTLKEWENLLAPPFARDYYELNERSTLRDVLLAMRADESIHRDVNHRFSDLAKDADVDEEVVTMLGNDNRVYHEGVTDCNQKV